MHLQSGEVPGMKKLKALFVAVCLVLAILVLNIPDVNYGHGPGYVPVPAYDSTYEHEEHDEASG